MHDLLMDGITRLIRSYPVLSKRSPDYVSLSDVQSGKQSAGCASGVKMPIIDLPSTSIGVPRTRACAMPGKSLLYSKRDDDMKKDEIIRITKARLEKVGHGISFDVIKDGVRQEESWWYVPVISTRKGKDVPREITVNIFANVEDELEQKDGISVLFIPAIAEIA
jgi:hypothetical protein